MHNGDTFAVDVVRECYLRSGTDNMGSPEFTELLEPSKDRVYDANVASAAKTIACQRFGGVFQCHDRNRGGGGGSCDNFKNARHGREAAAPRATFTKDVAKDYGK
eukprot:jgi/Tetstr1/461817/TSEL_006898.t1